MSIQLQSTDFRQLRNILANLTEFKTVDNRLDFLEEMLQQSPRKADILGRYRIDGAARGAASRLINLLCDFGQDIPNHEVLNYLINSLLDYLGDGPSADFLNQLQNTITLTNDPTTSNPSPSSEWDSHRAEMLHQALLGAFNVSSLRRMLRFRLSKQLDHLVTVADFKTTVFDLIEVAEREGWVIDLTLAAHQDNPNNQRLSTFAKQFEEK